MVGLHRSMFRRDRRAFDQRQKVALHAFARDVGAAAPFARANLVHLVDEHDAVVLDLVNRFADARFLIDQLVALFGEQRPCASFTESLRGLPRCIALPKMSPSEKAETLAPGMFGNSNIGIEEPDCVSSISISLSSSSPARRRRAERLARAGRGGRADQRIERSIFGRLLGARLHVLAAALLDHHDGDLDQIAHDLLDVAADIADLGEFRRFDFQEGRIGETRETPRDFGLAAAGRADHEDVLRQHLFAHLAFELQPAPAVAQRDRDGALCIILPNDIAIEFGNDLAGREVGHGRFLRNGSRQQAIGSGIILLPTNDCLIPYIFSTTTF